MKAILELRQLSATLNYHDVAEAGWSLSSMAYVT